jgi:DNA-binding NarL/FixJ family response regulator
MSEAERSNAAATRLLVVDDHPFFREGITAWIQRQPGLHFCGAADSPTTAIEAVIANSPDLVLLDLQLRDGDGFEVLKRLNEAQLAVPVIVVSHKDERIFAERALHAGARGYVLKEEASEVLAEAIRVVLDGGVHLSRVLRTPGGAGTPSAASSPSVAQRLRPLFPRELEVLKLLGRGRATKEIAAELGISVKTVESYRESLKRKLGLPDGLSLVRLATIWAHEDRFGSE